MISSRFARPMFVVAAMALACPAFAASAKDAKKKTPPNPTKPVIKVDSTPVSE